VSNGLHFVPFLQIVHISDLHVVDPSFSKRPPLRNLLRWMNSVRPLREMIEDGTAPHDPGAVRWFVDFLNKLANDPIWRSLPTVLVDTGDVTTFGDSASFARVQQHLGHFANALGRNMLRVCTLYGNHDAWPEDVPALNRGMIPAHTLSLKQAGFNVRSAAGPLKIALPHGSGEVQLFSIDSVLDAFLPNTLALGEVDNNQISKLAQLIDSNRGPIGNKNMRILLVHHPVH
jgi:hypothetical protein